MYEFRDINETSEGDILPSEALQINGDFIEVLIPGYRTLNVSGREALSPELDYFETGSRDGSTLKNKRYPARIITVRYQLIAENNEAFREAYNQLAAILNAKENTIKSRLKRGREMMKELLTDKLDEEVII
jgi:phage-related protein